MSKQSGLNAYRVLYEHTVRADLEGGKARGGERGDAEQRQAGALARRHGHLLALRARAYTRPHFGSTQALSVE